jgi:hypothetical protein
MIRNWSVIDLDVFRRHKDDPLVRFEEQDNKDGTRFRAYDIQSYPDNLIVFASPTMRLALERGVRAVEPLPVIVKPRKLKPQPNLQDLVESLTIRDPITREIIVPGYPRITPQMWAELDAAKAEWIYQMRFGEADAED